MQTAVAPTHLPSMQTRPPAQSARTMQLVLQPLGSQEKSPHALFAPGVQVPAPSQVPCATYDEPSHDAGEHFVLALGSAAHVAVVVPSQVLVAQTLVPPDGQRGRTPCGAPVIGTQVPSMPFTSHASH